jgi:ElaB/YqjD/DUF883 family membrane-anchored ribosome-binding protein
MDQEPNLSAKDPGAIRHDIEETRAALTEKLETLEHEVKDSVRNAKSAVVDTVEAVKSAVESTVGTVRDTVEETMASVKHTFDLSAQVRKHPWPMFGGSMAVGFLAGSVVPVEDWIARGISRGPSHPVHREGELPRRAGFIEAVEPAERRDGWLKHLGQQFAPEIDKLKGLAIGTAVGLVRDLVKDSAPPTIAPQLSEILDSVAIKLGGQPMGRVVGASPDYSG